MRWLSPPPPVRAIISIPGRGVAPVCGPSSLQIADTRQYGDTETLNTAGAGLACLYPNTRYRSMMSRPEHNLQITANGCKAPGLSVNMSTKTRTWFRWGYAPVTRILGAVTTLAMYYDGASLCLTGAWLGRTLSLSAPCQILAALAPSIVTTPH